MLALVIRLHVVLLVITFTSVKLLMATVSVEQTVICMVTVAAMSTALQVYEASYQCMHMHAHFLIAAKIL